MSTSSVEKLNINGKGPDLKKTWDWFEKTYTQIIADTINEFWEIPFDPKLVCIGEDNNFLFEGSEYFVTRIKLSRDDKFVIRLSKETVQLILDSALGFRENFELEDLTELEAKLLTAFNNEIYTVLSDNLYTEEEVEAKEAEEDIFYDNESECNFTFYLKEVSDIPAKIVITAPSKYLKYEETVTAKDRFGIGDFPSAKAYAGIYVGATVLPLSDVKCIEKEDIIVLENSNINKMTLNFEDNEIGFKVSPDPSLIISFDSNSEGDGTMSNAGDIWDNIQVELSAEFEKVKISLGEIKQISEGLVLDIGSVYENKVYLKVENKTIADGELVIINDRYGVRVDNVFDTNDGSGKADEPVVEDIPDEPVEDMNVPEEMPSQDEPNNENSDEFDYKDFDVDDENI